MRWDGWPASLVGFGVLLVWAAALAARGALGPWEYVLAASGVLILLGAWGLRRLGAVPSEIAARWEQLAREQGRLDQQRDQLVQLEQALAADWEQQSLSLTKRQQDLADKLSTYQEWLEFPEPVNLARSTPSDAELRDLAQRDRALIELLERERARVFDDILQNKYSPDGKFNVLVLRDDVYSLITRVAQIYRPESQNPLLETNLERVFRAASHACLQFLVTLEQLPLNVPQHDLNSLYSYVRQAVKAYGVYKAAEPCFPYLSSAYYLGRFALGANPVSLGAWWFLRSLGTQGAKALVTRLVKREALNLLDQVIRVIGFEVAGLYSEDFRHRDANWIYAAELTELAKGVPLSREGLAQALQELSVIQLRNEYDRVYLVRCLAQQQSAQPERYRAAVALTLAERQAVAARLERFGKSFVADRSFPALQRWQQAVEQRLDLKLSLGSGRQPRTQDEECEEGLRALASFLLEIKEQEPGELPDLLAHTQLSAQLAESRRTELCQRLQENPPFFFQPPDLDPANPIVDVFLDDLVALAVRVPPHHIDAAELLAEAAGYLRKDTKTLRLRLEQAYVQFLAERLPADAPLKRLPAAAAKAVLDLLSAAEQPRFVYGGVSFPRATSAELRECRKGETWLVGVGARLVAFTLAEVPRLLWEGDASVVARCQRGYLVSDCELTGGAWLTGEPSTPPIIRVAGAAFAKYTNYFASLTAFCCRARQDA